MPSRKGLVPAFAAYISWGFFPLYWKLLVDVEPLQILACRIAFSLVFVAILLAAAKKVDWLRLLANRKTRRALLASSSMIAINWGLYIWAINTGHAVEASLGYFINPLVNVLFGLFFFREKLGGRQWLAFALAATGVLILTAMSGGFPWIALSLALSFALYGLAKKTAGLDSLSALGAETLLLFVPALAFLAYRFFVPGPAHPSGFSGPLPQILLLAFSGVVTALPLLWFADGAKALPLSTMGFIQFVSPTLQFLLAVFVFREAFPLSHLLPFCLVWSSLVVFSLPKPGRSR